MENKMITIVFMSFFLMTDLMAQGTGVKFEDIRVGQGDPIELGQRVQFTYKVIVDGQERVYAPSLYYKTGEADLLSGLEIGILGMKKNGIRKIIVPPEYGYAGIGVTNLIPPNRIFEVIVELKQILKD